MGAQLGPGFPVAQSGVDLYMRLLGLTQPPSASQGDVPPALAGFQRPSAPFGMRFGGSLGPGADFGLFPYSFTNADQLFRGGGGGGGFIDTQLY